MAVLMRAWSVIGALAGLALVGLAMAALPAQAAGVLDLQPYRQSTSVALDTAGGRPAAATLTSLHPGIDRWYLLTLDAGSGPRSYHLENPLPLSQSLALDGDSRRGLVLTVAGAPFACELWRDGRDGGDRRDSPLQAARSSALAYAPLCDGRLYLRNPVVGHGTALEKTTDFLRDHVFGAERLIGFVRNEFYNDAFLEKAGDRAGSAAGAPAAAAPPGAPAPARQAAGAVAQARSALQLGIALDGDDAGIALGRWYGATGVPGVFVSVSTPGAVAPDLLAADRGLVNPLDAVESSALAYLVAFDLAQFELGFALGTDHPRVGWSERVPDDLRDASLPGPDGIATIAPLVATGMVRPDLTARTTATFTGGFKRQHGAFHSGALSRRNHGSHYGFIEAGVMLSRLQPGLATLYTLDDGTVSMSSWTPAMDALLPRIVDARQNGVPLIEADPSSGQPRPGALVTRWGDGNWSGSETGNLRSLRAGACLLEQDGRRFLAYGYFSAATPSAMVRVFQSYGCRYAMHLDMNALEHTYLALYAQRGGNLLVQHLVRGMEVLDRSAGRRMAPRFLGYADDRDFFYLLRRQGGR